MIFCHMREIVHTVLRRKWMRFCPISHDDDGFVIKAEVYGDGVDIWLRGQGDIIEVLDSGKPEKETSLPKAGIG